MWKIRIKKAIVKQCESLPREVLELLDKAISDLQKEGPFPAFWNVKKLSKNEYRLRLNYRYRMKYKVAKDYLIIEVFYIGHRKNAYANR